MDCKPPGPLKTRNGNAQINHHYPTRKRKPSGETPNPSKQARFSDNPSVSQESVELAEDGDLCKVSLSQLTPLATLGVGAFGRVDLVCVAGDKSKTYALKCVKKTQIVDAKQQENIYGEKNILMELRSDWIVRLYKTYTDCKYVYMMLEVCLGGELWTCIRDHGPFGDLHASFYVACVLEALQYLHERRIIYRDLKPENCLITNNGYLKLVDFGFARKLPRGARAESFCGTPEYLSPEIILSQGHDYAADLWALGIYTYELLCGRWFLGFKWESLRNGTLPPPVVPKVGHPADTSNFDHHPPDPEEPPDEFSGWDEGF